MVHLDIFTVSLIIFIVWGYLTYLYGRYMAEEQFGDYDVGFFYGFIVGVLFEALIGGMAILVFMGIYRLVGLFIN